MLLEHLALDLEAVAEQDHDQRHGRQLGDERRTGIEAERTGDARSEDEAHEHEQRGQ